MTFKFDFDERAFNKLVEDAANDVVQESAQDMQRVLDGVYGTHAGRPVEDVLTALRTAARSAGWKFTEAELLPYAEAISERTRIVVQAGPVNL